MNVAVKLYKHVPGAPAGMPGEWPAEVRENVDVAPGPEWLVMSVEEFEAYKREKVPLWDAYEAKYQPKAIKESKPSAWQRFMAWLGLGE